MHYFQFNEYISLGFLGCQIRIFAKKDGTLLRFLILRTNVKPNKRMELGSFLHLIFSFQKVFISFERIPVSILHTYRLSSSFFFFFEISPTLNALQSENVIQEAFGSFFFLFLILLHSFGAIFCTVLWTHQQIQRNLLVQTLEHKCYTDFAVQTLYQTTLQIFSL